MPREKRATKILNIKLIKETNDQLEKFCDETGMTKTTAVEKILRHYFEEYFQRSKDERTLFS